MVGLGFMRLIAECSAELVHLRGLGLELGADDYVTKPFTWREVAARIQAMRHSPGADQSISFVKPFQLCRPPYPS
jgi:DNA-binding response OmpR family regulator